MTEPTIPQNIEMEMALLGGIIATNKAYEKVAEYLQPIHFSQQVNGDIYAACSKMIEAGQLADRRTLEVHFGRDRGLAELGGPAYLDKLLSRAATLVETGAYGKDIYDIYLRREIIALGTRMANQAHPYEGEGVRQIERIEQDLYELATNGNYEGGFLPFNETIDYVMKMVEVHRSRDGALSGVSTGLNDLDAVLGGLHSSELVILAGRASTGAALATTIAYEAAEAHHKTDGEQGAVVGYFSLEMSAERLATRIISNQAKIPQEKLYKGLVNSKEFDHLHAKSKALSDLPIFIDDTPSLTVGGIRTRARRLKRQQSVGLIIVDYLQLISENPNSHNNGRSKIHSETTKALKQLAKELDVPVLLLARLPAPCCDRANKYPTLGDLSFINEIEDVADTILLLFSHEKYLEENFPLRTTEESEKEFTIRHDGWCKNLERVRSQVNVIIAKNSNGPEGTVILSLNAFGLENFHPMV